MTTKQPTPTTATKPKLAVFKFASCDGCQLSLLDAEDELLAVAGIVDIAYFLEATSRIKDGPYDITLVQGSITTPHDEQRIQEVRRKSKYLITIGACATAGGIQALRNWADIEDFTQAVYASPQYISTLATSTAIADHVAVDFELRGCPINQFQLIEVLKSLLAGRKPRTKTHSVCMDCKQRGNVCITVATGEPCLGPITQSGCGAICPTYNRGCYGCFGPATQTHAQSLTDHLVREGAAPAQLVQLLRNFNSAAAPFLEQSNRIQDAMNQEGDNRV
jgi:sulfhydrogenase subunit delta